MYYSLTLSFLFVATEIETQLNNTRQERLFNIQRYSACVPNTNCNGIQSYVYPSCGGGM